MTQADITTLHELLSELRESVQNGFHEVFAKIDTQATKLDAQAAAVAAEVAKCSICRPIVLGNGSEPIDRRVTKLETLGVVRAKVAVTIASIVGAVVAAVVGALLKWGMGV